MLDTIALAASDSLLIFFVFNVIFLAVVFGSKPQSGFIREADTHLCAAANSYAYTSTGLEQNTHTNEKLDIKEASAYDSSDFVGNLGTPSDSGSSSDDFSSNGDDSGSSGDDFSSDGDDSDADDSGEEDDELKRRVEEFIAKVNREWKAELITSYMGRT